MVNKKTSSIKLRELLHKLGIKSAEVHWMEFSLMKMLANYGQPDELYMSPTTISGLAEILDKGTKKE